uniref:Uncharacterized protein n=1 Tax=Solanum lycopersicum TaxID=4081 RepID=A0A3Q7JBD2_SOLLC
MTKLRDDVEPYISIRHYLDSAGDVAEAFRRSSLVHASKNSVMLINTFAGITTKK